MNIANLNAYADEMTDIAEVLKSCKDMGDNLKVVQKFLAKLAAAKAVERPATPPPRYQHLPTPFGGVPIPYPLNRPVTVLNTPLAPANTPVLSPQINTPVLTTRNTEPMTYQDAQKTVKESNVCLRKHGYKIDTDYYTRHSALQKAVNEYSVYDVLQKLRALIIIYKGKNGTNKLTIYNTNLETDFAVLQTQSQTTPPPPAHTLERTQKIRQDNPPPLKIKSNYPRPHLISLEFYGYNPNSTDENERISALLKAIVDHGKVNVEYTLSEKISSMVIINKPVWQDHLKLRKIMDIMESDYFKVMK